jgi:hypothetical protein
LPPISAVNSPGNSDPTADENIDIEGGIEIEKSSRDRKKSKKSSEKRKQKEIEKAKKSKKRQSKSDIDQGDIYDEELEDKSEMPAKIRRLESIDLKTEISKLSSPVKVKIESSLREQETKHEKKHSSEVKVKSEKKNYDSAHKSDSKTQVSANVIKIKPEREQLIKSLYLRKTEEKNAKTEELKQKWLQ